MYLYLSSLKSASSKMQFWQNVRQQGWTTSFRSRRFLFLFLSFFLVYSSYAAYEVDMGFSTTGSAPVSSGVTGASSLYSFPNLAITGSGGPIRVVRVMFMRPVDTGSPSKDQVRMAALPTGWAEQAGGSPAYSTQHGRVYTVTAAEGTPEKVQAALRNNLRLHYNIGKPQEVMVLLDEVAANSTRNIYYSAATTHFYEFVSSGTTWVNAYNAALDMRFMGLEGYLATITSDEEQQFIKTVAAGVQGWIGGARARFNFNVANGKITSVANTNLAPWYWAAGPEFDDNGRDPEMSKFNNSITGVNSSGCPYPYNAWSGGEPNNASGEYYVHLLNTGLWNDYNGTQSLRYMVEYRGNVSESNIGTGTIGYENSEMNAKVNTNTIDNGTATLPVQIIHGDIITYSIEPVNVAETSTNVTVTDVLPDGLNLVSGSISNNGIYNPATRTITWTLSFTPGDKYTPPLTFQAQLAPGPVSETPIRNNATVVSQGTAGPVRIKTNSVYHIGRRPIITYAADPSTPLVSCVFSHATDTIDYGSALPAGIVSYTTNPGFSFANWSYAAYTDLKGVSRAAVSGASSYTSWTAYGDMTVTANFNKITYNITYNFNGGTNNASNPSTYVVTDAVTFQPPTRVGYNFSGWENSSGVAVTGLPQGSTGDTTIVANWEEIKVNAITSDTVCHNTLKSYTFASPAYTGNPTVDYSWTTKGMASIGLSGSGNGNISFTAVNNGSTPLTDTITVTPKIGTNAGTPLKFGITVLPVPRVNPTADTTICYNGTVSAAFTTPVTNTTTVFDWSYRRQGAGQTGSGSGNISSYTPPSNTSAASRTDTVIVTPRFTALSGTACPGVRDTFLVKVNPKPQVNLKSDTTVCNGGAVSTVFTTTITGAAVEYYWTSSNPQVDVAQVSSGKGNVAFTSVNNGMSPIFTNITVTPKIAANVTDSCGGDPMTYKITVDPTPRVHATVDTTICNGGKISTVFGTPNTGVTIQYNWSYRSGGVQQSSGTGNMTNISTLANGGSSPRVDTVVVTPVISTNLTCPGVRDTFLVKINPTPQVNAVSDTTVCNGGTVSKSFSTSITNATVDYYWTSSNATVLSGSGKGNLSFTATNSGQSPITTTVTVMPKIAANATDSCSGTAEQFNITVNPTPQVNSKSDTIVCNGEAVNIPFSTTISGATVEYYWTSSNAAVLSGSGKGALSFTAVNTGQSPITTTITVTPKINANMVDSCGGSSMTFDVTVNPAPQVNPTADTTVCNGGAISTVFATSISGASVAYDWSYRSGGVQQSSGSGNMTNVSTVANSGNSPRVDTVVVTPTIPTNLTCSGIRDTFLVTVNPTATVNALPDTIYYDGQSVALRSITSPVSGATFAWTNTHPAIGLAASGSGASIPAFTAVNTGTSDIEATITITPSYGGCAGTSLQTKITVKPRPKITYDYDGGVAPATPNPATYIVGVGCSISNAPTKTGYPFSGWICNDLNVFTGVDPLVVPTTETRNLTVKADWGTATPYNITYTDAGIHSNPATYNVATPTITLSDPVKPGETFIGWMGTGYPDSLPHLTVTIPQGSLGDRAYKARWAYRFPVDTLFACDRSVPFQLQSGHDGESCKWTLPDGSTTTALDITAASSGTYTLQTDYGIYSKIVTRQIAVLYAFEDTLGIRRDLSSRPKIGYPQTFEAPVADYVNLNADAVTYSWSFPGGAPSSSTAARPTIVFNNAGEYTATLSITVVYGMQTCTQAFTYDFEIFELSRGVFVNQNVTGGKHNGQSWSNAYETIQEALSLTSPNDFIYVAEGVYELKAGESYVLMEDSVEIYGGFVGNETYLYERNFVDHPTILRGAGGAPVVVTSGVSSASRFDGFIIEGGDASGGGGIHNASSSVTIANTIIRGNRADKGGGIYNDSGNPVLYNVEISGNIADQGAGMYNINSSPIMTNVTISGNSVITSGGGLYNRQSSPQIYNSIVWGNRSSRDLYKNEDNMFNETDTRSATGVTARSASLPFIAYSLIEGAKTNSNPWDATVGVDGGGNTLGNPMFEKEGFDSNGRMQRGNYRTRNYSPVEDAGRESFIKDIRIRSAFNLFTRLDESNKIVLPYDLQGVDRMHNNIPDMGAYENIDDSRDSVIVRRPVVLPPVTGVLFDKPVGVYWVEGHQDFDFTMTASEGYSIRKTKVLTGIAKYDEMGGISMTFNADSSSAKVIIHQITDAMTLSITGAETSSSVETVSGARIWSHGDKLYVEAVKPTALRVYSLVGQKLIERTVNEGLTTIPLMRGIYTVTIGGKAAKVLIK